MHFMWMPSVNLTCNVCLDFILEGALPRHFNRPHQDPPYPLHVNGLTKAHSTLCTFPSTPPVLTGTIHGARLFFVVCAAPEAVRRSRRWGVRGRRFSPPTRRFFRGEQGRGSSGTGSSMRVVLAESVFFFVSLRAHEDQACRPETLLASPPLYHTQIVLGLLYNSNNALSHCISRQHQTRR